MPGGDRTGPLGMGPMTGRALGNCTGHANRGRMNYAPERCYGGWGRGGRWGGRGRDRGFGWFTPAPYAYFATDETHRITRLEEQARYLEDSLKAIRKEITEVKSRKGSD